MRESHEDGVCILRAPENPFILGFNRTPLAKTVPTAQNLKR